MEQLQAVHQKYITEETSVSQNLNFGQSAFMRDWDPLQARQTDTLSGLFFFLCAPVF